MKNVLLLCGGRSAEHDVSLASARSVLKAEHSHNILPRVIDRAGNLLGAAESMAILEPSSANNLATKNKTHQTQLFPSILTDTIAQENIDVVFPLLHGPFGEDGKLQGLLELLDIPYVGAGVLASAVSMDKIMMKAAFAAHGLPQVKYHAIPVYRWENYNDEVMAQVALLEYPVIVKPANMGSSIGISKAKNATEFVKAMNEALKFDRRIVVEKMIVAREIEVAVLGNIETGIKSSNVGEISFSNHSFYDYETKYTDGEAQLIIPAKISEDIAKSCQKMALEAFRAVDGRGLARVDFFLTPENTVYINEINTMPGFTPTSMYPKLCKNVDLSYGTLIDKLITLALS